MHNKNLLLEMLMNVSRILLIIPETVLNVYGTAWAFCGTIVCKNGDKFSKTVIESKCSDSYLAINDLD